jgi:hypothetical protein
MVIRTEYRGQRYSMGSSDPLPAGFEIRFGSLNFQATGNGYLIRITNREELRARRQTGPAPAPVAPAAGGSTPASTDAAGPSAPRYRRRSGQHSRQARTERRQAARAASLRDAHRRDDSRPDGGALGFRTTVPPRLARHNDGVRRLHQHRRSGTQGMSCPPRLGGQEPQRLRCRRVIPWLCWRAPTRHLTRVCGVGLLRRTIPGNVPTVPQRRGLLVRLLRRLQCRELRPHMGVFRGTRQRSSGRGGSR